MRKMPVGVRGDGRYSLTKNGYKCGIIPSQIRFLRYFAVIRRAGDQIGAGGRFFLFFGIAGGIIQVRETHDRTSVQGGADGEQKI
jgi:hypothetical protein